MRRLEQLGYERARSASPWNEIGSTIPASRRSASTIEFDPQRIAEQRSYSLRARITVGGRLWFITARPPSSK
jgi:hypothetical protein